MHSKNMVCQGGLSTGLSRLYFLGFWAPIILYHEANKRYIHMYLFTRGYSTA